MATHISNNLLHSQVSVVAKAWHAYPLIFKYASACALFLLAFLVFHTLMSFYEAYEDDQPTKQEEYSSERAPDRIPSIVWKKREKVMINHKLIEEKFNKSSMNQSYSFPRHGD